ncbi:hypothetical protein [Devosia sp. CN2-171]|uniref:hypothetical protein n=1 Tax=Devosia sp. CN2-171 TaxID=3400909 RepID=UPI003BF8AE87
MTKRPFLIRAFCSDETASAQRAILASLPSTFHFVDDGAADIALVTPDCIELGLTGKPRALVLAAPCLSTEKQIDGLSGATIPTFPILHLAATMTQVLASMSVGSAVLVRSEYLSRSDKTAAWLEQLVASQVLLGTLTDIRLLVEPPHSYSGSARTTSGVPVLWGGQIGAATERFDLDIVGLAERIEVLSHGANTARPAQVTIATADGLQVKRAAYQSGLLLFWRAIAAELSGTMTGIPRLADIVPLLLLVQQLSTPTSVVTCSESAYHG